MTDGDVSSRSELVKMEVREFYNYLTVHEKIIDKRRAAYEKQRKDAQKRK